MSPSSSSDKSADEKLRIGLIGPGRIATAHLAAVRANSDLAQLVSVAGVPEDAPRARELIDKFGGQRVDLNPEAIFTASDIDAVIITTPNHLHRPLAVQAFKAGKHVLVEKPMTMTTEDADAMIAAARDAGRVLMAGQCRRHFKGAQLAKARIGELGRPLNIIRIVCVHTPAPRAPWWKSATETGGLALGLNGSHAVDTMNWLIGVPPIRVYAQTRRFNTAWEGDDQASLIVSYADGSMGTVHLSHSMRPPLNDTFVIGPNGTMRLQQDRNLWLNGQELLLEKAEDYLEGDSSFENQFKEFAIAIREGRNPQASGAEVRDVTRVLEAAHQSAVQNRPIELAN